MKDNLTEALELAVLEGVTCLLYVDVRKMSDDEISAKVKEALSKIVNNVKMVMKEEVDSLCAVCHETGEYR
ncbi:hypothetical protein LCGC14_2498290 [marine sediment metagenome]|uniref:Uncharacterized protein n=1 Tax=marine sediment metagenome TaxID=412755 RepID=A0A0F9BQN0_9ZZZZ